MKNKLFLRIKFWILKNVFKREYCFGCDNASIDGDYSIYVLSEIKKNGDKKVIKIYD